MGPTVYRPYLRRLDCLTICGRYRKSPERVGAVVQRSTTRANQAPFSDILFHQWRFPFRLGQTLDKMLEMAAFTWGTACTSPHSLGSRSCVLFVWGLDLEQDWIWMFEANGQLTVWSQCEQNVCRYTYDGRERKECTHNALHSQDYTSQSALDRIPPGCPSSYYGDEEHKRSPWCSFWRECGSRPWSCFRLPCAWLLVLVDAGAELPWLPVPGTWALQGLRSARNNDCQGPHQFRPQF